MKRSPTATVAAQRSVRIGVGWLSKVECIGRHLILRGICTHTFLGLHLMPKRRAPRRHAPTLLVATGCIVVIRRLCRHYYLFCGIGTRTFLPVFFSFLVISRKTILQGRRDMAWIVCLYYRITHYLLTILFRLYRYVHAVPLPTINLRFSIRIRSR